MTIFGGSGLETLRAQGRISWEGSVRGDALLLELGGPLQTLTAPDQPIDPTEPGAALPMAGSSVDDWATHIIAPQQLILAQVRHRLRLDRGLTGSIGTLSHIARLGLMSHLASPFIEGGWDGFLTLELFNAGPAELVLSQGMPVAKVIVYETSSPSTDGAQHGYGAHGNLISSFGTEFGRR